VEAEDLVGWYSFGWYSFLAGAAHDWRLGSEGITGDTGNNLSGAATERREERLHGDGMILSWLPTL